MSRLRTIDDKVDENQDRNEIRAGRHLTPLKRRGSDSSNGKTDRNSISRGIKTGARALMLGALLIGAAGCATTGGYAQAQQQNVPSQQYEDIDYENMNLLKSDRVYGEPDFYGDYAVFIADVNAITKDNLPNLELFISDKNGNNTKRLTSTKEWLELNPKLTKNNKIVFCSMPRFVSGIYGYSGYVINKTTLSTIGGNPRYLYYELDLEGKEIKEIRQDQFERVFEERGRKSDSN